jgi:tetratricopeptide (TPR) repeat protein
MFARRFAAWMAAALLASACLAGPTSAQTGVHDAFRAVALVIGEAAYVNAPRLTNARNDAVAMASTLRDLGFDVVSVIDGPREGVDKAIGTFLGKLKPAEIAFVYYAGHGVQNRGTNYIVPIDAKVDANINFEREFVSLSALLERLEAAVPGSAAKIVVLDACRDNPWAAISEKQTGEKQGFAPIAPAKIPESGQQSNLGAGYFRIVAFSTAPGDVAADGTAGHSPYTQSLLRFLPQQGLEVGEIFRQAAADVQRDTNGVQKPEYIVQTSRALFLRTPYITDCDRVAIEGQNFLGLAGIPFDDVDPKKAVPACEDALKQFPNSARLHNNIARAYEKAERLTEALQQYQIAADMGYAPAINSLGIAYLAGCGLPAPKVADGVKLIVQARALGNLSARASLTSQDVLKFVGDAGIAKLQGALAQRRFFTGRIDGRDLDRTSAALASFQDSANLAKKGLTLETIAALDLYDIVPKGFKCH